jgi:hypothetical protein
MGAANGHRLNKKVTHLYTNVNYSMNIKVWTVKIIHKRI